MPVCAGPTAPSILPPPFRREEDEKQTSVFLFEAAFILSFHRHHFPSSFHSPTLSSLLKRLITQFLHCFSAVARPLACSYSNRCYLQPSGVPHSSEGVWPNTRFHSCFSTFLLLLECLIGLTERRSCAGQPVQSSYIPVFTLDLLQLNHVLFLSILNQVELLQVIK